jgi:hypothetical protein
MVTAVLVSQLEVEMAAELTPREKEQVELYGMMYLELLKNMTTKAMLTNVETYAANIQAAGRIIAAAIQARTI